MGELKMWIKIINGIAVESKNLPDRINATPDTDLSAKNWYYLTETIPPAYNSFTQKLTDSTLGNTTTLIDGKVQQRWTVVDLPNNQRPPNWLQFNLDLLEVVGYKTWEKAIKKSGTDDELYYQRLLISVGNKDATTAQYWYNLLAAKPIQSMRDAANLLSAKHNIGIVF